jgi:uncharacterized repeat protein (TIGR03803 family)
MKNASLQSLATRVCVILTVAALLGNTAWAASKDKLLYSFTGGVDGGTPATTLTFDSFGNAYGTTAAGGDFDLGTVFKLTPSGDTWTETVLYSFAGGSDGSDPHGGVILDSAGNLYGTTVAGGTGGLCAGDGCGTVFKLSPSGGTWSETILYNFRGGNDGFGPGGAVVFDQAGNLFGTTPDGGRHSAGTIYEMSPMKNGQWKEKVIHAFTGGKDGSTGSLGQLLFDAVGNLYGVTEQGGALGAGTVFELVPSGKRWTFTTLYTFKGMPDAASPYGGLIADGSGSLFGTTYFGGQDGMGAVFQLSKDQNGAWQENVLHSFKGGRDGSFPTTTLVFDAAGSLYGTTSAGGRPSCDCGTVFKLTPPGGKWAESVIHRFGRRPDGIGPIYGLTLDPAGNLYGTAPFGGAQGQGVVFELTP